MLWIDGISLWPDIDLLLPLQVLLPALSNVMSNSVDASLLQA